ncbi:MAG: GDP-mannose 4,6-dehydratase [Clostridia bacterium]|jgi:GDPmannose 4,6-dehydratase
MDKAVAVITGARGQDASYLADLLLKEGYVVVGFDRRSSMPDYTNIQHLLKNEDYRLVAGDLTDFGSIARVVQEYQPREFYNLAAQSYVGASWDQPLATCEVNFNGVAHCLEAIRLFSKETRFFQASTSEVYGDALTDDKQDEHTAARPGSPYRSAKYGAESLVKVYRDSYGLFACFARSFNHESERRSKNFVTRKITAYVGELYQATKDVQDEDRLNAAIQCLARGTLQQLSLGNIYAKRDWTHASDIVRGMWHMLNRQTPDDFVLASGQTHSVSEFLDVAFDLVGIKDWSLLVNIDKKLFRPADVHFLCGDASRAKEMLNWEPTISFYDLVERMVWHDVITNVQKQT